MYRNRFLTLVFVLIAVMAITACGGGKNTPTPAPTITPAPTSTPMLTATPAPAETTPASPTLAPTVEPTNEPIATPVTTIDGIPVDSWFVAAARIGSIRSEQSGSIIRGSVGGDAVFNFFIPDATDKDYQLIWDSWPNVWDNPPASWYLGAPNSKGEFRLIGMKVDGRWLFWDNQFDSREAGCEPFPEGEISVDRQAYADGSPTVWTFTHYPSGAWVELNNNDGTALARNLAYDHPYFTYTAEIDCQTDPTTLRQIAREHGGGGEVLYAAAGEWDQEMIVGKDGYGNPIPLDIVTANDIPNRTYEDPASCTRTGGFYMPQEIEDIVSFIHITRSELTKFVLPNPKGKQLKDALLVGGIDNVDYNIELGCESHEIRAVKDADGRLLWKMRELPNFAATPPAGQVGPTWLAYPKVDRLNVRNDMSLADEAIIGQAAYGVALEVISTQGVWVEIKWGNEDHAFVWGELVEIR